MPSMSRDEFMKEFARCTENERRIDLPSEILDGRAQFLFAVYEATHYRLTASELDSPSKIMELMIEDMDNHPERYEFLSPAKKSRRRDSSAPFGTSKDNPVQAVSIQDGYIYLNNLRTSDGQPVKYRRIGSMSGRDGGIIDSYTVAFNGKSIELYIDPYSDENSTEAPEGLTLAGDDTDELTELIEAAKNGDGHAQFELGMMYYHGEGVEQDYSEAFKWYHKAAEQGYSGAQTNLGLMYSRGHGVPQSYKEAVKWYKLAAEQGDTDALHNLGFLYANGRGVRQNMKQALHFWHEAAEHGHPISQFNIGLTYYQEGNYSEAAKWLKKSAEQGYTQAQHILSIMQDN